MMKSVWLAILCGFLVSSDVVNAQNPPNEVDTAEATDKVAPAIPDKVDVEPLAQDPEISTRLLRILQATQWFEQPDVKVDQGVVFLSGQTRSESHREWAGQLAGNTQDVVAVVNRIQLIERSMWDLSPAWEELRDLGKTTVQSSPLIAVNLLLIIVTWFVTSWSSHAASYLLQWRMKSSLLRDVTARAIAVPVFLLGLYLVLKVSGLSRLAMTVLGGTGILGLVMGFAFRDIAENFLASILISMQHPFASGDLIEVAGYTGYVQSVNTRSTLLMTLEGNHVQIPNATIYKQTITNFTANPSARFDFTIGIGYDDSIELAQSVAMSVLSKHPAIVQELDKLVLVENLGASTVNLRIYFWIDIAKYSSLKVNSAIIRLVKQAFDEAGISMPDEAREVVFPNGVPVHMISSQHFKESEASNKKPSGKSPDSQSNAAEGDLSSESKEINQQAQKSRSPESGQNLLDQ
ncbi:mechanosensitive ion channel family protein [Rubinisphaera italica]|uniref:Small-conductance mechanosensitive channel n=1 Tax=Rubinisphaera italica TaxID=2527969 RepID=A0A5C5XK62_9PLAN|nr:mechanosensitive ion channel family protein [Rubinisphaera italica]TWT63244.1 Small-conductance mechanosensitive channel [Rubinisphaera italica]